MPARDGRLMADVRGDIEKAADGVIFIRRIHVRYRLRADHVKRDVIDRVMAFHVDRCPVARSLGGCIEITTEFELVAQPEPG